jgi:hypothetical protein
MPAKPNNATKKKMLHKANIRFVAENLPSRVFNNLKKNAKPSFLSNSTCFLVIPFPALLWPEIKLNSFPIDVPQARG